MSAEPFNDDIPFGLPPARIPELGDLLDELVAYQSRYVVMTPEQRDFLAFWVLHTHAFAAATALRTRTSTRRRWSRASHSCANCSS